MDDIEALKTKVAELEAKLADRNDRLKRAWSALQYLQNSLEHRTGPDSYKPESKSFDKFARLLAEGFEAQYEKLLRKYLNLTGASRRIFTWVGRAPRNEKEEKELKAWRKTFDLAISGIEEGVQYESFYEPAKPQMYPKPEESIGAAPACDSPTTEGQPAEPPSAHDSCGSPPPAT